MMIRHKLLLLVIFLLQITFIIPSFASQTTPLPLWEGQGGGSTVGGSSLTMGDGLLSNSVRSITQDQRGFLWFATDNGLCRYDGINVKQYRNKELGGDQYTSTVFASGNSLYVGTNKGVYTLDATTETFQRLSPKIKSDITAITSDADNALWISTTGQGIFCKPKDTENVVPIVFQGTSSKKLPVTKVYVDNENQIWAFSKTEKPYLWRLNKSTNRFTPVKITTNLEEYGAQAMLQTQDGTRWLGTWNHGILRLDADGRLEQKDSSFRHIHCLYEASPNQVLIGCDDGLKELQTSRSNFAGLQGKNSPFLTPLSSFAGLQGKNSSLLTPNSPKFVYSILKDAEGGIWYSTFYGGVNYISPIGHYFQSYYHANTPALQGQVISRFCEDPKGNIWVASDDGGLCCFKPQTNSATNNLPSLGGEGGGLNVHALCMDGNDLWIGTYSDGIYIKNIQSGAVRHLSQKSAPQSCYSIFKDSKNRIWVSSMTGILLYDRNTQQFRPIKEFNSIVIDMDEDRTGKMWFSTQSNGLWTLDRRNHWKHYSLANDQINSVCITSTGRYYIATSDGLYLYKPKSNSFELIDLYIPVKDITGIVESEGDLWLSTDKGILKYTTKKGILIYNRYDGLACEQFMPNSALIASDGRVYFGSINGFCAFYPYQVKINNVQPNVVITALEIFNKPVAVGSDELPKSLQDIEQLDLYSGDDMFTLFFSSLSYCSPKKNLYAYMLEGFDKDWVYCGSENKATYTNLPAGTYIFHVRGTNNDGEWSSHEATLKIVIHPPFYWSWPAKILYLLLIIAGIYFYVHERLRREKVKHQQELDKLKEEQERQKEKQEQEVQKARLAFFTMIAHEIRTPVSLIIAPLEQLIRKQNHSEGASLSIIDRNAHRLLDLVNQLLDFNKMQHRGLEVHFKETNIRQLMEAVAERFAPTFEKNGYKFEVDYPDEAFTANIDPEGITKVISNLLTNANKYTKDYVKLSCEVTQAKSQVGSSAESKAISQTKSKATSLVESGVSAFTIVVEDNGIGISKADQEKIFDAFYQARDNKPGTGIGLNIVKRIVDLHHGDVSVESEEGKGSKFIVKITSLPITPPSTEDEVQKHPEHKAVSQVDNGVSVVNNATATPLATKEAQTNTKDNLLLVEDNPDMLDFLSANLSPTYSVLTAENGREALEVLRHNNVSLIVSDWMMPVMDGATFCRCIRSNVNTSHIPFIMLTAKNDGDSKAESMVCGADAFIEKPFSMNYLEACITNLIDMRKRLFQRFSGTPEAPITEIASNTIDDEFLKKMNKIIEENINNADLNVNFLAEQLAISRSGLFAKIKSISGTTPNEMIQVVRLKRAAQLLATKQYRINEVCYMVGFSNPSYFTKCFSKQFNKKPAEFIAES